MTEAVRALPTDPHILGSILHGAQAVVEGLDVEQSLSRIVDVAQEITHARFAACGVPGETGHLHFIFNGVDATQAAQIGPPPDGHGIIGRLLDASHSIRINNLDQEPGAAGVPQHHPPMTTFLGVPITHRQRNIGAIYLTDKRDRQPFTTDDQSAVEWLAGFAAVAITNSHQHLLVNEQLEQRRQELDDTAQTLRALSNRTLWLLESERRLLAQELHDGVGQVLAAATFAADAIVEQRIDSHEGALRLRGMLRDAVGDLRRISHGLRPSVLDELGPVTAIRNIVDQMDATNRDWINLDVHFTPRRLPEPVETVLFRVAQEALTNATRHSGASHIQVDLTFEHDATILTICDDGIGMTPKPIQPGLGIAGMRERAALINGTLQIDTHPGKGTTVTLTIPDD